MAFFDIFQKGLKILTFPVRVFRFMWPNSSLFAQRTKLNGFTWTENWISLSNKNLTLLIEFWNFTSDEYFSVPLFKIKIYQVQWISKINANSLTMEKNNVKWFRLLFVMSEIPTKNYRIHWKFLLSVVKL